MPTTQPTRKDDPNFICHDLEPSAYLWARGVRFVGVHPLPTPNNPNHVIFIFHDPDRLCGQELKSYYRGAKIPAHEYALALKQLKDELFRSILL